MTLGEENDVCVPRIGYEAEIASVLLGLYLGSESPIGRVLIRRTSACEVDLHRH